MCDTISPLSLLEDSKDNPVKSINTVRPDFDGAVLQFLIGLYQVLLSPADEDECRDLLDSPPSKESLSEKINLISPAFVLDDGEFRFMQDASVRDTDVWTIQNLLIEINNTHFLKEGTIQHLCPKCAAAALLTLELNSPSGGRGHMTSLRGGGPLTTLVCVPDSETTLWKSVMLNVLPKDVFNFDDSVDLNSSAVQKIFPWVGIMPNSENGEVIVPNDLHPYHVFWNVPRRVYLDFSEKSSGYCDVCGGKSDELLTHYWSRPNGIKYVSWSHPLTSYYLKKDKSGNILLPIRGREGNGPVYASSSFMGNILLPIRGREGGVPYANWVGIVFSAVDNSKIPALSVQKVPDMLYGDSEFSDLKIHVFGYAMDNAKARVWQEGILPAIVLPENVRDSFFNEVSNIINEAENIIKYLIIQVKSGVTSPKNGAVQNGKFNDLKIRFWHETEPVFYSALNKLREAVSLDSARDDELHPKTDKVKSEWLSEVRKVCLSLFRERVMFPLYGEANPSLAAVSEIQLRGYLSLNNSKLCKTLGLPVPEKKSKPKVKK